MRNIVRCPPILLLGFALHCEAQPAPGSTVADSGVSIVVQDPYLREF